MATTTAPSTAPVLSTPDTHIFTETESATRTFERLSDEQLFVRYEIQRTIDEIKANRWRKVALQFPDPMLGDGVRVYRGLQRGLREGLEAKMDRLAVEEDPVEGNEEIKLTILGDTSYGSCCVDEIAAEHVDADVVVHYGRSCLSPTARLPVVYVFTRMGLNIDAVCNEFMRVIEDKGEKVIVTADTPFADHVEEICDKLREEHGYTETFAANIIHDPSSVIPNRTVPEELRHDKTKLVDWCLFHVSEPPTSLLLTLASRMKSVHIYPTTGTDSVAEKSNTSIVLRRRYALVTSLSTVSTWGILINTLSVKNYLHIVDHVKRQIAAADKKSYLFVVGKLNAAKVANFAEIGGWVVIGCWESSLIDSRDFYRPIITPFELELALKSDEERVWTGEWRGDFQGVLDAAETEEMVERRMPGAFVDDDDEVEVPDESNHDWDSEEESAPPEFDLRTGKYISHTRPMRNATASQQTRIGTNNTSSQPSTALTKRSNGELFAVKGVASPAAEFLAQKRTWKGLGTDFEIRYDDEEAEGSLIEEGRTGVARGYTVGDSRKS